VLTDANVEASEDAIGRAKHPFGTRIRPCLHGAGQPRGSFSLGKKFLNDRHDQDMDEIREIIAKYDEAFVGELNSLEGTNKFALTFYKDVAEIYDCITRMKNVERNPTGFSLNDAPILGLLIRV